MPKKIWSEEFYIKIYELTLEGLGRRRVSEVLGVGLSVLRYWYDTKPALRWAIERAREKRLHQKAQKEESTTEAFFEYCYKRLPEALHATWDRVAALGKEGSPKERVDELFEGQGVRVRQHLFVHAMVMTNFNASEACRLIGISRKTWELWQKQDPKFNELLLEIHKIKKDWAESQLLGGVARGDAQMTIFVNRTLNRDRGYDLKQTIKVEGQVNHLHAHIDIDELELSPACRREILEAHRKRMAAQRADQLDAPRVVQALPAAVVGTNGDTHHVDEEDDDG